MDLEITRPIDPNAGTRRRPPQTSLHGTTIVTRPLHCATPHGVVRATHTALPFRDGTFSAARCDGPLAHVRDDEALLHELGRILRPGACLHLTVPAAGPLAGFDALNLFHYLVDVTKRGHRPVETDEIGWRRHYRRRELVDLLAAAGFTVRAHRTHGLALAELADFGCRVVEQWLLRRDRLSPLGRRLTRTIARLEARIPTGPLGFWLTLDAVRTEPRRSPPHSHCRSRDRTPAEGNAASQSPSSPRIGPGSL